MDEKSSPFKAQFVGTDNSAFTLNPSYPSSHPLEGGSEQ